MLKSPRRLDVETSKILKYLQLFTGKMKKNQAWKKSFEEVFGSEEELAADVYAENWKKAVCGLFQFTTENLFEEKELLTANSSFSLSFKEPGAPDMTVVSDSSLSSDDLVKYYMKSDSLAQNISIHKHKIQKIYESLKESVDMSKGILGNSRANKRVRLSLTPSIEKALHRNIGSEKEIF